MIVKCINNDGDKRLNVGDIYLVNVKIKNDVSMSLVGMGGKYLINRFIDTNNEKLTKEFYYYNNRYNPPYERKKYGYVIPIPNRLKILDKKLYKIKNIKIRHDYKSRTSKSIKQVNIDGYKCWFNSKNFLFYTEEEGKSILREEKMGKILNKI